MNYTMDDIKRMLRTAAEIVRAGLADDATDEEKNKMNRLLSDDLRVSADMIESILEAGHEKEDM